MTNEQAKCFVAVAGFAMAACGLILVLRVTEDRMKVAGAKLGAAGLLLLVVAAIQ